MGNFQDFQDFLKNLFKRRKKPTTPSSTNPTSPDTRHVSRRAVPARANDTAPQLPPLQTGQNPIDFTKKPLPPTHPLATGEKTTRQTAVPPKAAVQLGLSPGQNSRRPGSVLVEDRILQQHQHAPGELASGPPSTKNEGGKDNVSAISAEDVPPAPPPKEYSLEPVRVKERTHIVPATSVHSETPNTNAVEHEVATNQVQPRITNPDPTSPANVQEPSSTTTIQQNTTAVAQQDVPPSSTTVDSTASHTIATPATEQTNGSPGRPTSDDGKMLLMEEPPPIKPIKVAPGMSATSGPLEDFFEGGEPVLD